ncbi:MAG: glucosidase, partial [Rhizobacter sp.]|nr:glucosidase [Ferruginibacter sp.]
MQENKRIAENYAGEKSWMKWGPYLSERQWATVREDYSPHGSAWDYFPHDHARSRVYRWGEDGIAGISDEMQRLCFSIALWNGKDPILKERLFGVTGPQGNHGEDVKELYYYLDNTPTHSYMKHLYKYPTNEFPYLQLVEVNAQRNKDQHEFELIDTGAFDDNNYFDVFTEFAKADEEDILIKIVVHNRSSNDAPVTLLPQIWFRNLWGYGLMEEKPVISHCEKNSAYEVAFLQHPELGEYYYYYETPAVGLFTENETNTQKLWNVANASPFVKDLFHTAVINDTYKEYTDKNSGTKFSPIYNQTVKAKSFVEIKVRLTKNKFSKNPLLESFDKIFTERISEADEFYDNIIDKKSTADEINVQRQAFAGMLWSKQYYNIDIPLWLNGDEGQPVPPASRKKGRNSQWHTLNNEDIISMPDKWEYPWYAAWDLAFHCIPLSMV